MKAKCLLMIITAITLIFSTMAYSSGLVVFAEEPGIITNEEPERGETANKEQTKPETKSADEQTRADQIKVDEKQSEGNGEEKSTVTADYEQNRVDGEQTQPGEESDEGNVEARQDIGEQDSAEGEQTQEDGEEEATDVDTITEVTKKPDVNVYITGLTKTVTYNGEEHLFPSVDGIKFFEITCDNKDFDTDNVWCNYGLRGKHAGEYAANLSGNNFHIYSEFASEYSDKFGEIKYIVKQQPKLIIKKAKVTITTPSLTEKYEEGKVISTKNDVKIKTNLPSGTLPLGEGYVVRSYTKLSKPGKTQNVVDVVFGMMSATKPGVFLSYDEIDRDEGIHYFMDDYDITYDFGTLQMTETATETAAADAGSDATSSGAASDNGELVADDNAGAYISDGKSGYTIDSISGIEEVPKKLVKVMSGGWLQFISMMLGVLTLIALVAYVVNNRIQKNRISDFDKTLR